MTSSSIATVAGLAFSLLLTLQNFVFCEASSSVGSVTWMVSPTSVHSPEETADFYSLISFGTEMSKSAGIPASAPASSGSATGVLTKTPTGAAPRLDDVVESGWEATFASGVFESKKIVEMEDSNTGSWVSDAASGGAAVPARMLQAEALLQASDDAPVDKVWKEKTADRALRLYYHAKWLAERNYARAAEHRYRESARIAKSCRRSVLASHSLARLGYFLIHWKRVDEATEVLEESMKLNVKSNPLAPYLHGVLERKANFGDMEKLRIAEEQILSSGEQPSQELELERIRLIEDISYWREAEGSSRHCFANSDPAFVLICLCGHAVTFLKFLFK